MLLPVVQFRDEWNKIWACGETALLFPNARFFFLSFSLSLFFIFPAASLMLGRGGKLYKTSSSGGVLQAKPAFRRLVPCVAFPRQIDIKLGSEIHWSSIYCWISTGEVSSPHWGRGGTNHNDQNTLRDCTVGWTVWVRSKVFWGVFFLLFPC